MNNKPFKKGDLIECEVEHLKEGDGLVIDDGISCYDVSDRFDFVSPSFFEKDGRWILKSNTNCKSKCNIIKEITPELARLCGYLIADGCFTCARSIYFCDSVKSPLGEDFKYCIRKVFGNDINFYFQDRGTSSRLFVCNMAIRKFFQYHCLDKNGQKVIPDFIMRSSLENKRNFIKAYVDCDGTITSGMVKITTVSKNIRDSLIHLMIELGVFSSNSTENRSNKGNYYENAKDIYNIICGSQLKFLHFRDTIGTSIQWRKNIMDKYETKPKSRGKNVTKKLMIRRIKRITVEEVEEPYYHIEIDNNHNYFVGTVGRILSSNSVGINVNIGIQSPSMLNEEIYSDIKHFFIYRCGNSQHLYKYIPNKDIVDAIRTLQFHPDKKISECIHVYPDRYRYERFFPFNCPIGN